MGKFLNYFCARMIFQLELTNVISNLSQIFFLIAIRSIQICFPNFHLSIICKKGKQKRQRVYLKHFVCDKDCLFMYQTNLYCIDIIEKMDYQDIMIVVINALL